MGCMAMAVSCCRARHGPACSRLPNGSTHLALRGFSVPACLRAALLAACRSPGVCLPRSRILGVLPWACSMLALLSWACTLPLPLSELALWAPALQAGLSQLSVVADSALLSVLSCSLSVLPVLGLLGSYSVGCGCLSCLFSAESSARLM